MPDQSANLVPDDAASAGLWLSISELAARKGVTKQTISERVSRLIEDRRLYARMSGRRKLVELTAYDRAVGETTDLTKLQAAATSRSLSGAPALSGAAPAAIEATFTAAQRDKTLYEARLKGLDFAQRTGEIIAINGPAGVAEAMAQAGARIVAAINRLAAKAPEITAVVARDGEIGARRVLRAAEHELREAIARELRLVEADGRAQEAAGLCTIDIAAAPAAPADAIANLPL